MKSNSLCIIIPMYNEEQNASKCINEVMAVISHLKIPSSLLVINDGSDDRTKEILSEMQKKYINTLIIMDHKKNRGYGVALQTGIKEAIKRGFKFCVFMDSDLTNDPKFIPRFVENIRDDCGCIKASRYVKGGKMIGVPLHKQLISRVGNIIASNLFRIGIRDCTNGFRLVRLNLLEGIKFKEKDFSIILEELYYLKQRGARFKELPNTLTSRRETKTHFRYTPGVLWHYLKYCLRAFFVKYEKNF